MAQRNDQQQNDTAIESNYTACRHGQQLVQEIVLKTTEMFSAMKSTTQPSDSRQKLKTLSDELSEKFKQLHQIFIRLQEQNSNHQMIDIDHLVLLPPSIGNRDRPDSVEKRRLIELIQVRSRQMKQIIDKMRSLISDVNLMMAMRKPQLQLGQ